MANYVVWMDRIEAKLIEFSHLKMERMNFHVHHHDHHTHPKDQIDNQQHEKKMFQEVVAKMVDPSQILILGPGVAKHHFHNFIIEHHPMIAKKIVGCETVDHPTDNQIAALATKFFKLASMGIIS